MSSGGQLAFRCPGGIAALGWGSCCCAIFPLVLLVIHCGLSDLCPGTWRSRSSGTGHCYAIPGYLGLCTVLLCGMVVLCVVLACTATIDMVAWCDVNMISPAVPCVLMPSVLWPVFCINMLCTPSLDMGLLYMYVGRCCLCLFWCALWTVVAVAGWSSACSRFIMLAAGLVDGSGWFVLRDWVLYSLREVDAVSLVFCCHMLYTWGDTCCLHMHLESLEFVPIPGKKVSLKLHFT